MKIILSESVFLLIENRVDFLYDKYVKSDQVEEEIFQELKEEITETINYKTTDKYE